jgi:hypothetical protein
MKSSPTMMSVVNFSLFLPPLETNRNTTLIVISEILRGYYIFNFRHFSAF